MSHEQRLSRLNRVIHTQALGMSPADFLATHQPFKNLHFVESGLDYKNEKFIEETEFEEYFMSRVNEHNFIVVQGDSGSGKSHIIQWLKNRYCSRIDPNKELVVLIMRSQNTLRGAIKQIISSDLFDEMDEIRDLKEKLLNADKQLSPEELSNKIISEFALSVQNDQDNTILRKQQRSQLRHFLLDDHVQELLLTKPGGPIDRIKNKLVSEENLMQNADDALFRSNDFVINFGDELLKKMNSNERRSNAQAIMFAENLMGGPLDSGIEFREKVAKYLNQKVNYVIQNCMDFRSQDMLEIFLNVRRVLRSQNRNLTLFIEDITSFTGIDQGVIEALVVDHTVDHDLCRLSSVVGVTTGYYTDRFPDNVKERITARILISDMSLFTNERDIIEFSAKYINAINLEEDVLDRWMDQGALESQLPIADTNLHHQWSVIEDHHGRKISLFPFNENALMMMYKTLNQKTPRRFLYDVLHRIMTMYYSDPASFPPNEREFSDRYFSIPNYEPREHELILNRQANKKDYERINTLFKYWGKQHVYKNTVNGKVLVGGLSEDVFQSFNLMMITGTADNDITVGKPGDETKTPEPTKTQKENPAKREYEKFYNDLKEWRSGKGLQYHQEFREFLIAYLKNSVHWENEGVSAYLVQSLINLRHLSIEGQTVALTGFIVPNNQLTYEALLALITWRYKENQSWDFEDSMLHLTNLYNWLLSIKDDYVQYLKGEYYEQNFEWALINDFYILGFSGELSFEDDVNTLYHRIMQPQLPFKFRDEHSAIWNKLQSDNLKSDKRNYQENHNFVLRYYNSILGTADAINTKRYYIDAYEILKTIGKLVEIDWDIHKYDYSTLKSSTHLWYRSGYLIKNNLSKTLKPAIESDLFEYQDAFEKISQIINLNERRTVDRTFIEMDKFLGKLLEANEVYREKDYVGLRQRRLTSTELFLLYNKYQDSLEYMEQTKRLIFLSLYPTTKIKQYLTLLEQFRLLVESVHRKYKMMIDRNSGDSWSVAEMKKTAKKYLESYIQELIGGGKNASK